MTSMKIVQFSRLPTPLLYLRPKLFHPLDLGCPISNELHPPLQIIINQIKNNIIQGWLFYVIRSFLQVGFCFQYQLSNLVWLSFDFFSFSWSLTICLFVAFLLLCVQLSKNSSKCLLFIIIHIFSTHFAINLFYLHNLKK